MTPTRYGGGFTAVPIEGGTELRYDGWATTSGSSQGESRRGSTPRRAIRVVVLPLPAGAMVWAGPSGSVAAANCSASSDASRLSSVDGGVHRLPADQRSLTDPLAHFAPLAVREGNNTAGQRCTPCRPLDALRYSCWVKLNVDQLIARPLAGHVLAPGGKRAFVLADWSDDGARGAEPIAPPHVHLDEDEAWYVLEGRLGVRLGDREVEADAGSAVFGPRGVAHTYWNAGPGVARYLLVRGPRTWAVLEASARWDSAGRTGRQRPVPRPRHPTRGLDRWLIGVEPLGPPS
jgi:mannose-6-phosphate isomerase-like protein (cupin superfamily)